MYGEFDDHVLLGEAKAMGFCGEGDLITTGLFQAIHIHYPYLA